MKITCPLCKQEVGIEDVNVAKDVAFCRRCNQLFSLSDLVNTESLFQGVDLNRPPRGAWYRTDGITTVAGASHRSVGTALGALVFGLFWNGIVSIFVLMAISGTLQQLHITPPVWFPAPKMHGGPMSVGMVLFLWIFLSPFIAVGLFMIGTFFMSAFGRSEFSCSQNDVTLFSGVGSIGRRRRFRSEEVASVRIDSRAYLNRNGYQERNVIVVESNSGQKREFGSMLNPERQRFLAAAMASSLLH